MATQQEIIDVQYDIKLSEQQEKLKSIFSEVILGWARRKSLYSYSEITSFVGEFFMAQKELSTIKGLSHLVGITSFVLYDNNLSDLGDISGLTNLTRLSANANNLTDVVNISDLVNLARVDLYSNQLTSVGSLLSLKSLETFYVNNNFFTTSTIDKMLSDLRTSFDAGAPLSTILLQDNAIPTDGILNADYVYLVSQGVSVTIDS